MRLQRAFDQHRIDVVATADDQVLRSAGDENPPRLVGISKITAVEIAVANRARVVARIAITRRDVWSGNRQHADLMRRTRLAQNTIRAELADDDVGIGNAIADRSQHRLRARGSERHHARGFRHPDDLMNPGTGHGLELLADGTR
jgi:hypothetical protein